MKVAKFAHVIIAFCLALAATGSPAEPGQLPPYAEEEALLLDVLDRVRGQQLDAALAQVETLVEKNPKFRLAQLVYGDLLQAKARPIDAFGALPQARKKPVDDLLQEAHSRLQRHLASPPEKTLPAYLLRMAPSQSRVAVVDLSMSRLYLFERQPEGMRLLADYYAASGKNGPVKLREGDNKTPVGVYFISGHIAEQDLPDLYGAGAFPLDYPNPWDRRLGRTGYGIWLHGVPSDTYSRPPRSSNGCVALANTDLKAIAPFIDVGNTPMIIAESIQWEQPDVIAKRAEELESAIEKWRQDWESRDITRYASNYSRSTFLSGGRNYKAWVAYKQRVNEAKSRIEVALSDLSIFTDPGEPSLAVVRFLQRYESNNFQSESRKRQYWQRETDGAWRIVYEGGD